MRAVGSGGDNSFQCFRVDRGTVWKIPIVAKGVLPSDLSIMRRSVKEGCDTETLHSKQMLIPAAHAVLRV